MCFVSYSHAYFVISGKIETSSDKVEAPVFDELGGMCF